jgi:hypothetical protein
LFLVKKCRFAFRGFLYGKLQNFSRKISRNSSSHFLSPVCRKTKHHKFKLPTWNVGRHHSWQPPPPAGVRCPPLGFGDSQIVLFRLGYVRTGQFCCLHFYVQFWFWHFCCLTFCCLTFCHSTFCCLTFYCLTFCCSTFCHLAFCRLTFCCSTFCPLTFCQSTFCCLTFCRSTFCHLTFWTSTKKCGAEIRFR